MRKGSGIGKASKALAVLAAAVIVGACGGSPQARSITLTFVRHAESEANIGGTIATEVPGPGLTPEGKGQAEQVAHQLLHNNYDAVYASTMTRAQQTAEPLASELHKRAEILQGIQEINAGWFDGKPVSMEPTTYLLAPADWLNGDVQDRIPGSINGKEFNDRFTAAVQQIYDSHHTNAVVFGHKNSIEYWTLMNVKNAKDSLRTTHPLPNIGRVVISGSPTSGWTLQDWDGIRNFGG